MYGYRMQTASLLLTGGPFIVFIHVSHSIDPVQMTWHLQFCKKTNSSTHNASEPPLCSFPLQHRCSLCICRYRRCPWSSSSASQFLGFLDLKCREKIGTGVSSWSPLAIEKHITINNDLKPVIEFFFAEGLVQIVLNILVTSIQYSLFFNCYSNLYFVRYFDIFREKFGFTQRASTLLKHGIL